jgi:hypothetical protein
MNTSEGVSLNLRGTPPELRDALRALAQAEGLRLYQYVLSVLTQHVARDHPRDRTCVGDTSG